jgi:hypothetical protein
MTLYTEPMKTLREIPLRYRMAAVALGAISIFLFGVVALIFQQEYRIAVNPRVMGRIERTWIITRGKRHNEHVRVADFTFTVTHAGESINCRAEGLDIGDATFDAKAGDSIDLSPIPESCARPSVINIQPPTWVVGALSALVAATAFVFALAAWGALSDPESKLGSWVHRWLRRRYGI